VSKSRRTLVEIVGYLSSQLAQGWAALAVAQQIERSKHEGHLGSAPTLSDTAYGACLESAILALARLTVAHKDSISVEYLLNCVQQSPSAFPIPQREAVIEMVSQHRTQLQGLDPLVEQIKDYRDRTVAHLDKRHVNQRRAIQRDPPADKDELACAFVSIGGVLDAHRRALDLPVLDLAQLESDLTHEWASLFPTEEEGQA
jgi:hypothetical protein